MANDILKLIFLYKDYFHSTLKEVCVQGVQYN